MFSPGCKSVVVAVLSRLLPLVLLVNGTQGGLAAGRQECPGFDSCPDETALPGPLLGVRDRMTGDDLPKFEKSRVFPEGFEWGVGTAAYQIEGSYREGGRGASIWDTFTGADTVGMPGSLCAERPCPVNAGMAAKGATGNVANAHYRKYNQDVATMAGLGVATYRFSVAWPRVIPTGIIADGINKEGLAFYHALVDDLLAQGIKPVMSIYHWDLPQGLLDASYDAVIPICDDLYRQLGCPQGGAVPWECHRI
mmetsp:Transcript_23732/g.42197  ORF Transcript_23732/g.42197 Transcript_23732/m.42197 type:complete len:252 (-) Transcript_23732:636-1391(-)